MIDLPEFDVTIPLVRRNPDGTIDQHDVTARIPAADKEAAETAAAAMSWEILAGMRQNVGDNNRRHGWTIASYGEAVEPAKGEEGR